MSTDFTRKKIYRISTVSHSLAILLKNQFKYLTQLGYDYTLMCFPDDEVLKQSELEGTSFFPLFLSRKFDIVSDLRQLFRLIRFIRKNKPNIIHTHSPKAGLVGMLAAKITGVRCRVHTVAGLPLVEKEGAYKLLLVQVEKIVYRCAQVVLFNSKVQAQYVINNKWISPNKVRIINKGSSNGIDVDYFKRTETIANQVVELNNKIGKRDGDYVITFVGRIAKSKGIDELVNAFIKILKTKPNTHLVLVGSEDDVDPISKDSWHIINQNQHIHWFGYKEDVRPYFQMSDIFAFPSYREGFPQVIMQACAMECAIVATDINGANEIIDNNSNGILIDTKSESEIEQACLRLINDPELRRVLSSNSRNSVVEGFRQTDFWNELDSLYCELLGGQI